MPEGGQFVLHAAALHGNPYDGHTLVPMLEAVQQLTGVRVQQAHAGKGYRGHGRPAGVRVFTSGQKRGVTAAIRREMKRRAAVEPVVGHMKDGHRLGRNHLKGREGDRANAVLAAAGYNFRLLLRWLAQFLRALILLLVRWPAALNPPAA
jgi:transposase, IS5 family